MKITKAEIEPIRRAFEAALGKRKPKKELKEEDPMQIKIDFPD